MINNLSNKQEVAKATCLSPRTIDNLVASAAIPSVRVGSRRLFVIEDVIAALISGAADPTKTTNNKKAK